MYMSYENKLKLYAYITLMQPFIKEYNEKNTTIVNIGSHS